MTKAHEEIAKEVDALLAPVGKNWWKYMEDNRDIAMYASDGQHASVHGSRFAAGQIYGVIRADLEAK